MEKILIIDDDKELCQLVMEYLEPEGFVFKAVHDGNQGMHHALSGDYVLIILDVMLPGLNGLEVLRRIRAQSNVPVIMLTARGDDIDRIIGLEIGADDYLPKPFNPRELLARLRAILRRVNPESHLTASKRPERLQVNEIELDLGARTVRRDGVLIELTTVEFDLLENLMRSAGSVVTRETLSEATLGRQFNPFDRSIDMHISNLRRKLGTRKDGVERIKSIRGVGYIFTCEFE